MNGASPRLAGDGFVLRPWRPEDAASLQRHADDARVSAALSDRFPFPYTMADAQAFLDADLSCPSEALAIEIDGCAVGGVGVRRGVDEQRFTAEIGYWLGRSHWGRGLMPRIVPVWCAHLFASEPLERLQANVHANNPASARVLEKCGFVREGVRRNAVSKRGELLDAWMYAILRPTLASK